MTSPSSHLETPEEPPPSTAIGSTRVVGLLLLFAAEMFVLTIRFEGAESLGSSGHLWARLAAHAHLVVPLVTIFSTVFLLWHGLRLGEGWQQATAAAAGHSRGSVPLIAHFIALLSFALLSSVIFEGEPDRPDVWWPLALWVVAGLASFVTLVLAMFPLSTVVPAIRGSARPALWIGALGLAAWGAAHLAALLWEPLGMLTFSAVRWVLGAFYPEVVCHPESMLIGTSALTIKIAPACGGYQGIGLTSVFLGVFLWSSRSILRFPAAFVLIPLGIVAAWSANVLRLAVLVVVGTEMSPEIAVAGFHSHAGWILFCAVSLGTAAWGTRWRFLQRGVGIPYPSAQATFTSAYVLPIVALCAASLILAAFTVEGDPRRFLAVLVVAPIFWRYRRDYGELLSPVSLWSYLVGVAVFLVWIATNAVAGQAGLQEEFGADPAVLGWGWLTLRAVGFILVTPLVEELAFRGYLTRRLISRQTLRVAPGVFTWLSFVGSAVAFGLLHDRWIVATIAGALYGMLWYRRGHLSECVVAHAVTNLLIFSMWLAG